MLAAAETAAKKTFGKATKVKAAEQAALAKDAEKPSLATSLLSRIIAIIL